MPTFKKNSTCWLDWKCFDIHRRERGMKTFLKESVCLDCASRRTIRGMMTHNIWSHEGNSMFSYAQNQQDHRQTDSQTRTAARAGTSRLHMQPVTHSWLSQKRSAQSHVEVMTRTCRSQNDSPLLLKTGMWDKHNMFIYGTFVNGQRGAVEVCRIFLIIVNHIQFHSPPLCWGGRKNLPTSQHFRRDKIICMAKLHQGKVIWVNRSFDKWDSVQHDYSDFCVLVLLQMMSNNNNNA